MTVEDRPSQFVPRSRPPGQQRCGTREFSRLVDDIETVQLGMAARLLRLSREALGAWLPEQIDYRTMSRNLVEALADVLRIAESRGNALSKAASSGADSTALAASCEQEGR
ncbi:hypothetical protein ACWGCW_28110 [Streptomyces sp. NPDC054933]